MTPPALLPSSVPSRGRVCRHQQRAEDGEGPVGCAVIEVRRWTERWGRSQGHPGGASVEARAIWSLYPFPGRHELLRTASLPPIVSRRMPGPDEGQLPSQRPSRACCLQEFHVPPLQSWLGPHCRLIKEQLKAGGRGGRHLDRSGSRSILRLSLQTRPALHVSCRRRGENEFSLRRPISV